MLKALTTKTHEMAGLKKFFEILNGTPCIILEFLILSMYQCLNINVLIVDNITINQS